MSSSGRTACERMDNTQYRPAIVDFVFHISGNFPPARLGRSSDPLPLRITVDIEHKQPHLEPAPDSFADARISFGFVDSIGEALSPGVDAFVLVAEVLRLLSRYGVLPDGPDIFVSARLNAWVSKAVLAKNYEAVCAGMPARGLIQPRTSNMRLPI